MPEPDIAALRLHLARLRHERGLSYDQLAAISGVGRSTIVYLESGASNRNPERAATSGTVTTCFRLARALGVPLAVLLAPLAPDSATDPTSAG